MKVVMRMKTLMLSDVVSDYTSFVIAALSEMDVPWSETDSFKPNDLDYFNHSHAFVISWITNHYLDDTSHLSTIGINALAAIIFNKYNEKWSKLYATYALEYNPISNYDMSERMIDDTTEHTYNSSEGQTNNLAHAKTGTEALQHNTTNTRTPNLSTQRNLNVQGFNSSDYQPSDNETGTETGTETNALTGTDTTTFNTNETNTGTLTKSHSGIDTDKRNYVLTRSGNIGVTTSQDMINSERELWMYDVVETIYRDIDSVLCLNYFIT